MKSTEHHEDQAGTTGVKPRSHRLSLSDLMIDASVFLCIKETG
jgi:hypothetical protein